MLAHKARSGESRVAVPSQHAPTLYKCYVVVKRKKETGPRKVPDNKQVFILSRSTAHLARQRTPACARLGSALCNT